jgi:hypothetical protein
LREAECTELLRAQDIPGREEALESSDVIVVRIFLTNTGGEEGEAQERARMSYRKSAEIVMGCGDGCQKSSWRGVVTRGTIERRW